MQFVSVQGEEQVDAAKQQQGLQVGSLGVSVSGNQNVTTTGNQDTSVSVSYGTPPPTASGR